MANYQITNRTGAQIKAVLDKFTTVSSPNTLTLTGAISGGSLTASGAISGGTTLVIGSQKSGTTLGTNAVILGSNGTASGNYSHAEGYYITASGTSSHAEGDTTTASGANSHTEGFYTTASGPSSHAEGAHTAVSSDCSHAEGFYTTASGKASHAEGGNYYTDGTSQQANWQPETGVTVKGPLAYGTQSHAEGVQTYAKNYGSHAEGFRSMASGTYSHAEGQYTIASGSNSHAEGFYTTASGNYSHAEGSNYDGSPTWNSSLSRTVTYNSTSYTVKGPMAVGNNAHAEGCMTFAGDYSSHAEGMYTDAIGDNSHAEGNHSISSGMYSHAQGYYATASGTSSHAEGKHTTASGKYSHAEGSYTTASGEASHAEGSNTTASYDNQTAIGFFNSIDIDAPFVIGNGWGGSRWSSFWVNWHGQINCSPYVLVAQQTQSGGVLTAPSQETPGDNWIVATHTWSLDNPINSALNLWDTPNDGGFHTWIRQRTANNYFIMGVIPNQNSFYVAANPAGANTANNAVSKMLNWNGSNGSLSISGSLSQGSDRRLKNIYGNTTNEETLAILENVNIVNFSYKYDNDVENNIRSGIIAQDFQQILEEHNIENRAYLTTVSFPRNEALIESAESEEESWSEDEMTKEFLGISYVDLVPILIKGWQIHEERIKQLEEENALLKQIIKEKLNVDI